MGKWQKVVERHLNNPDAKLSTTLPHLAANPNANPDMPPRKEEALNGVLNLVSDLFFVQLYEKIHTI